MAGGVRLPIPDDIDPRVAALISDCWQADPNMRPSFQQIIERLEPLSELRPSGQWLGRGSQIPWGLPGMPPKGATSSNGSQSLELSLEDVDVKKRVGSGSFGGV